MASRSEQKKQAREERLRAEAAERARATRNRRLGTIGAIAVVAATVVAVALVVTGGGEKKVEKASGKSTQISKGVPQSGLTIGKPDAPVEVEEFIDMQCPFCKLYNENGNPAMMEYVRKGAVKVTLRPIAILGPQSQTAVEAVIAASKQNLAFQFTDTFFANQGPEGAGYVTDEFLEQVAAKTPGLDPARLMKDRSDTSVQDTSNEIAEIQQEYKVDGTPAFFASVNGGEPKRIEINPNDGKTVSKFIDPLIAEAGKN